MPKVPEAKKETLLIECSGCEATVEAEVQGEYSHFNQDYMDEPERFVFLECKRCHTPTLLSQTLEPNYEGDWDWGYPRIMYPEDSRSMGLAIPFSIRKAYTEAVRCFKTKAYTASTIMCRKVLEGVQSEHKARGRSLAAQFQWLKDNNIIDDRLSQWATELRLMGNEAVHDVHVTSDRQSAEDALDFTKALCEYIFTYRDKFDEFKTRRENKKKKPKLPIKPKPRVKSKPAPQAKSSSVEK